MSTWRIFVPAVAAMLSAVSLAEANAVVRGAYYQLGEDDAGATAGQPANATTVDSFIDQLDLTRSGTASYSSDVPARTIASTLSMQFGGGLFSRTTPLPMVDTGYALEAWVKPSGTTGTSLLAYNGTPGSDGFGFYETGGNLVARIGSFDRVLGAAEANKWHHVAYSYVQGNESYFYDGNLVLQTTKDPVTVAPTGGFWLGGLGGASATDLFSGSMDDVRFQSFNPLAAGSPGLDSFLISPIPEPGMMLVMAGSCMLLFVRRGRGCPRRTRD